MPVKVKEIIKSVPHILSNVCTMLSCISIILTITVSIEVIGRYVFDHPTSWVWPVNKQLFGIFILMALAYIESENGHIRIEIFYDHFPQLIKKFADWLSFAVKISFTAVLVWQTSIMAQNAIKMKESSSGAFKIPLYPFKIFIFLTTFIIACEILSSLLSKYIFKKRKEETQ
jgi:TRAP-type mannitol/chloroaromatic compound transport system permease small subunit